MQAVRDGVVRLLGTLARRLLDWTPKHDSLETIVRSSLDWELFLMNRSVDDLHSIDRALAAASF